MAGKEDSSEKQAHDRLGVNETETEETKIEEPQKTGSSGNGDLVPPTNSYVQNGSSDDPLDGIDGVLRLQIDDNFLQYASYVIRDRAIPKLDDGLKPVQRRILWSLHRNDDGKFIKVANITGYTMQFHPHGDASINDALVVLANKRYLIEGQGNYGNIYTGDRAAASRYIECRLTELARKEIFNDELTEFVSSYDGRNKEPVVLPCKLPMLLMLGADGIAVGLSARILPHNFIELLEAEIAVLRKKPFTILPDFVLGGLMDASDYNDGNGKIRIRARIEVKDKSRLIIRQLPFSTTTESLVNSIEDAARKGKIKIRSIQDFTSENVEIEILLGIGVEPDKAKQALYAFTDCEVPISSRIVVIHKNRPLVISVSEVVKHNARKLVEDLRNELELKQRKLTDELHFKTLVQIFVENRIYKRIEKCRTQEAVCKAVFDGFKPFKDHLIRKLVQNDVDMLLGIPIRRISLFDIEKHKEDMDRIRGDLDQLARNLKSITKYTIAHLKYLIKEYGKMYPRLTEITSFQTVTAKEVAAKAHTVVYDREKGYLGYQIRGNEFSIKGSGYDKLLILWDDGTFKVIAMPEKIFVGKNVVYVALYHREDVYTIVYREKHASYLKRFKVGGTILNKEYRCGPEKSKVLFFEEGTPKELYVRYKPAKGQRIHQQLFFPEELDVKSAKVRGSQITIKKISGVGSKRPRSWDEKTAVKGKLI
ncbi:MAG TPA: DNA topoisomerase IV subunit A [Verrucomicrobiales bacterium]|nr:DNA topoisomerase IV subunit A [Verrucomicrobiales bacterium]